MKAFAQLYAELDASTSTHAKLTALKAYFESAPSDDAAWAAYFLAGGRPRQTVSTKLLRSVACSAAQVPDWLFEECYQAVGDLAETIAHLLPAGHEATDIGLAGWMRTHVLPLRAMADEELASALMRCWNCLNPQERFVFNKLITGGFRVGVSKLLVTRALAQVAGIDAKLVAQRMMGYTDIKTAPSPERYLAIISTQAQALHDATQPYPFFLAHAINDSLDAFDAKLGPVSDWMAEWKYDGIRAQLVKRHSQVAVWSRGEELITERFPEVVLLAQALPNGTVIDGEILVWKHGQPAPFALLQQRIGRKTLTRKVLEDAPVTLLAYDLLEHEGQDMRSLPQHERTARLHALCEQAGVTPSPLVQAQSWQELAQMRAQSRARGVEGLMLKHRQAQYGAGRTKDVGTWYKWKIEPMSVDCVLIYAQAGHGRRASVYTDYTFAVWSRTPHSAQEAQQVVDAIAARTPAQEGALQLVPFAKAYSGLSDEEFKSVDAVIRKTTLEKFGPVRSVRPSLVFELAFEGINRSTRHKSGIAVRFPRMLRIRHDKPLHEADTLQSLMALLEAHGADSRT
jgi:DNA ligase-1